MDPEKCHRPESRIHTIGIFCTAAAAASDTETKDYYLLMATGDGKTGTRIYYAVQLDHTSSALVSPLYEHDLLLAPLSQQRQANSDDMDDATTQDSKVNEEQEMATKQKPVLENYLIGQCYYRLVAWKACSSRLAHLEGTHADQKLRNLLVDTYFLQMCALSGNDDIVRNEHSQLLHSLFVEQRRLHFGGTRPTEHTGDKTTDVVVPNHSNAVPQTTAFFDTTKKQQRALLEQLLAQRKTKRAWQLQRRDSAPLHTHALGQLLLYVSKPRTIILDLVTLHRLFSSWHQYRDVATYFLYQLLNMENLFHLHTLLRPTPGATVQPISENVLFQINRPTLCAQATYRLCQFAECIIQIITTTAATAGTDRGGAVTMDSNHLELIERCLAPAGVASHGNRFNALLSAIFLAHGRLTGSVQLFRERLVTHMISRLLIIWTERTCRVRAIRDRSTVSNVTLQDLYQFYTINLGFVNAGSSEAGETSCLFSLEQFPSTVQLLYNRITSDTGERITGTEWYPVISGDECSPLCEELLQAHADKVKKKKTNIFLVATQIEAVRSERENWQICQRYISNADHAQWHIFEHSLNPINVAEWRAAPPEASRQEFNFLLFSPQELAENRDIATIEDVLLSDLFGSVILREQSLQFLHRRLSQYFLEQKRLSMKLFHSNYALATAHFVNISSIAAQSETVMIPDCHLLSATEIRCLLGWLLVNRRTVRRVLFFGTLDLLPLATPGQAFADLVGQLSPQTVRTRVFNRTSFNIDFQNLLLARWTCYDAVPPNTEVVTSALLYFVKDLPALLLLLRDERRMRCHDSKCTLVLNCIDSYQNAQRNSTHRMLWKGLDKKVLGENRLALVSLTVDKLDQCGNMVDPLETRRPLFVIRLKRLLSLSKNEMLALFSKLDSLIVVSDDATCDAPHYNELLKMILNTFNENTYPNIRYSYTSIMSKSLNSANRQST